MESNLHKPPKSSHTFYLKTKTKNLATVYYNMMKSAAMTAEQQGPIMQLVKICSNATAVGTEIKEISCLPSEGIRYTGISNEIPLPPLPTLK